MIKEDMFWTLITCLEDENILENENIFPKARTCFGKVTTCLDNEDILWEMRIFLEIYQSVLSVVVHLVLNLQYFSSRTL